MIDCGFGELEELLHHLHKAVMVHTHTHDLQVLGDVMLLPEVGHNGAIAKGKGGWRRLQIGVCVAERMTVRRFITIHCSIDKLG